jgi:type IV secretion system protein TrbL
VQDLDPLWLNTILRTFMEVLTGGYLRNYEWVQNIMAVTVACALIAGMALCLWFPHPVTAIRAGGVILRMMVLWAVVRNWNFLFDGFLNSIVWLGLRVGGSSLTPQEFLEPGRAMLIGLRAAANLYAIVINLGSDSIFAPVLSFIYTLAWLAVVIAFTVLAVAVLFASVEFLLLSIFAFLMWPLMPIDLLAWIAEGIVKLTVGAALRLAALAALFSMVLPVTVALAVGGEGDVDLQTAVMAAIGVAMMAYIVWHGPKLLGSATIPGSGFFALGTLVVASLGRR